MSAGRLRFWAGPAFLVLASAVIFGPHVPWAGLHLDDHPFHYHLANGGFDAMRSQFKQYVPGRNLHILYTWLAYKAFGPSPVAMHLWGLALDTLNALLAWLIARRFGARLGGALMVAGLFLVFPNHGETHFWTSSIAMNLLSTTLVMAAALAAASGRAALALALFGLALFDYDQVFMMWAPILLCLGLNTAGAPARKRRAGIFAAGAIALCVAHVAIRHGAPAGSNPTIRLGSVAARAAQAAAGSIVPMAKLPAWDTLHSLFGGPAPTAILCAALAGLWVWAVSFLWLEDDGTLEQTAGLQAPGPQALGPLVLFGAVWWAAGYFPNLFWFLSGRHHYLPSLGALLLACAGVRWLAAKSPGTVPILAVVGAGFFGLSSALALGQGWSWKTSWTLMEKFSRQAPALLGDAPESVFLYGAPLRVGYAPAFPLTSEHAALLSYSTGRQPPAYGVSLAPTRTGLFWMNYPEVFGDSYFRWLPRSSAQVLVHGREGELACGRALDLSLPAGMTLRIPLKSRPACTAVPSLWVPVWLESSRKARPSGKPLAALPGGPALHSVAARIEPGLLTLKLSWSGAPRRDLAFIPRLYGPSGRLLYRPVYRERPGDQGSAELLWPLFNDIVPPSSWKKGGGVEETWLLRLIDPLPHGPAEIRLDIFERSEIAAWPLIGEVRAPVTL